MKKKKKKGFGLVEIIVAMAVFITIAILVIEGDVPFYLQVRVGKNLKTFTLIKFKTMRDARDEHGILLSDEERVTVFGAMLRKSSLDEFPQLFNIIIGDMSFVGPRPLLLEYRSLYSTEQLRRHDVRPGLTGWAQINGRNAISWQRKFEYDIWYVDQQALWLDMKILFATVIKVFKAEGVSGEGVATVLKFEGDGVGNGQ